MASTSVTHLPEELITQIASHISSNNDLLQLALTCQQLHRITAEFLYRERHLELGPASGNHHILEYLTIRYLTRPDLAACVKQLSIRGEWTAAPDRAELFDLTQVHPAIRSAVRRFAGTKKERRIWLNDVLDRQKEEALVVLLITALPNLRKLDIALPKRPGAYYTWLMDKIASREVKSLQRVRDLAIISDHRSISAPLALERVKPVFFLPGLRRVCLFQIGNGWDRGGTLETIIQETQDLVRSLAKGRASGQYMLSSVEHLEIRKALLSPEEVCELICGCHSLHTFIFELYTDHLSSWEASDQDILVFPFCTLLKALSLHASTLQNLSLYRNADGYIFGSDSDDILDLQPLSCIQHLKAPPMYLVGPGFALTMTSAETYERFKKLVPSSIRKLDFNDGEIWGVGRTDVFFSVLCRIVINKRTDWPCLGEIVAYTNEPTLGSKVLYRIAAANGVKLRLMSRRGVLVAERRWGMNEDMRWADVSVNRVARNHQVVTRELDLRCVELEEPQVKWVISTMGLDGRLEVDSLAGTISPTISGA